MNWSPTAIGRLLAPSPQWQLSINGDQYELTVEGKTSRGNLLDLDGLVITKGLLWCRLVLPQGSGQSVVLGGLPNRDVNELRSSIEQGISRVRRQRRAVELAQSFPDRIAPLVQWERDVERAVQSRFKQRGWLDHDFIERQSKAKPQAYEAWLGNPDVKALIPQQPEGVQRAVALYGKHLSQWFEDLNTKYQTWCLTADKAFFEKIEKSPLTQEQRQAVVCFDSRVLLVASAGSGKTSTMVAKAAYALKRGFFEPERILMLAFNNDAAAELRQRLKERLNPHGLPAERVTAKTFHAFGLDVIGQATGKKPSVAPWVESGQDLEMLLTLIDEIKDRDLVFRTRWDLFRIVLGQDLPAFGKEEESPDAWSRETNRQGFWTLNNEVVRSRGEQIIANWLFYNGVNYEYERPYEHDTGDAQHRQYNPDFYFPDVRAYLEHWAVDDKGNPPATFVDYKEGMAWKRALHARHGTRLLETTMADLWSGQLFEKLARQLTDLGIALDPNPDRPVPGRQAIENPRLARTIRMFQTHVKNNRLSIADVRRRLDGDSAGRFRFRHQMFLDLFEPIHEAWEQKLREGRYIDFEDMLNQAAEHIEQGRWASPYELVMVDEFQDASQARARLAKSLVSHRDACFFAVGDDWQSINRFAGADLGVMTRFAEIFGPARTLKLETTFRCPQSLCDISSGFVQKNPVQLRKSVRSIRPNVIDPVQIIKVDDDRQIVTAVRHQLEAFGIEATQSGQRLKVFVMGRYRKDRVYCPADFKHPLLELEFITAHSSKGLECDHVILPCMTSETLGFPSRIEDDPVMALAMPGGDGYVLSEERRLFYVALTRARRSVRLITCNKRESDFVMELVKDHHVAMRDLDGEVRDEELCPECGKGFLVTRHGRYGPFMACSNFPPCRYKRSFPKSAPGRSTSKGFPAQKGEYKA